MTRLSTGDAAVAGFDRAHLDELAALLGPATGTAPPAEVEADVAAGVDPGVADAEGAPGGAPVEEAPPEKPPEQAETTAAAAGFRLQVDTVRVLPVVSAVEAANTRLEEQIQEAIDEAAGACTTPAYTGAKFWKGKIGTSDFTADVTRPAASFLEDNEAILLAGRPLPPEQELRRTELLAVIRAERDDHATKEAKLDPAKDPHQHAFQKNKRLVCDLLLKALDPTQEDTEDTEDMACVISLAAEKDAALRAAATEALADGTLENISRIVDDEGASPAALDSVLAMLDRLDPTSVEIILGSINLDPLSERILQQIEQELHQASGPYGGLKTLRDKSVAVGDYPEAYRSKVTELRRIESAHEALLRRLAAVPLEGGESAAIFDEASRLKDEYCDDFDRAASGMRCGSAQSTEAAGMGEEAVKAAAELADRWRFVRITDAPNPFAKKKNPCAGGPLENLYNGRYIHIDGDEYVNAAKHAPAKRVEDQVELTMKKLIGQEESPESLDDLLLAEVDQDAVREEVLSVEREGQGKKHANKDKMRNAVIAEAMAEWYRVEGARILAELAAESDDAGALERAAGLLASGNTDSWFNDLPPEAMGQVGAAATAHHENLQGDGFPQDQFDAKVAAAVEVKVVDRARQRKGQLKDKAKLATGDYWVEIGKLVKKEDYGRCFSCAGLAIEGLVMNPAFDRYTIESVGACGFDHHFVLLGRTGGDVGSTTPPDASDTTTLVVDIWDGNQQKKPPMRLWSQFTYNAETKLKVYCVITPEERTALRERALARAAADSD